MASFTDYYQILGISSAGSQDDIKRSYRSLAVKYHPDRGGDLEMMMQLNEAYAILSDPKLRLDYNKIYTDYHSSPHDTSHTDAETEYANQLVAQLVEAKFAVKKLAILGFAWLVGGVALSIVSYFTPSTASSFIAWGPILIGSIALIRGLYWYYNPDVLVREGLDPRQYTLMYAVYRIRSSFARNVVTVGVILAASVILIGAVVGSQKASTAQPSAAPNTRTSNTTATSPSNPVHNKQPFFGIGNNYDSSEGR